MESSAKRKVLLGVTGGIAAYKSCLLLRRLVEAGCDTRVVMTRHATHFVGPLSFSTLSGHPVAADPFESYQVDGAEHVDLSVWADQFVVAPATANILAKSATGIADDFLSTLICAYDRPILFAPAMNHRMWSNAAIRRACGQLQEDGHVLVEPGAGWLACGETGAGRMAEPEFIHEHLDWLWHRTSLLQGRRVLISAGPTVEAVDDVRILSNRSSGRMGFALARAAQRMGAEVRLVAGPVELPTPLGVCRRDVRSAAQMAQAMLEEAATADVVIMCAAVADYAPEAISGKRKKDGSPWQLSLLPTVDILRELGALPGRETRIIAGFALEMERELEQAREKLQRKGLDFICLNNPRTEGADFGSTQNQITLLDRDGTVQEWPLMDKLLVAERILRHAALRLGNMA